MIPIRDFCSSSQIVWRYPCKNFGVTAYMLPKDPELPAVEFPWGSAGDWAACVTCSALIEDDDWDALAERSLTTSPAYETLEAHMATGEVKRAILKLHKEFRKYRGRRQKA